MVKQNFYMGQRITPENLNALQAYPEHFYIKFLMHAFGSGRFKGLSVTQTDTLTVTVEKGACIDANGSLGILTEDAVEDISKYDISTGFPMPVSVYIYLETNYEKTDAVVDALGETQYTTLTPSVKISHGKIKPEEHILIAEVVLLSSKIVVIDEKMPLIFPSTSS